MYSGLLTGHICYVYLFLHHNRSYIHISLVPCKSFVILTSYWQRWVSCMRQGMFTLSGAPSTTSHFDINILSILHYLGSPLGLCTLIFDLMRKLYIYNACTYILLLKDASAWFDTDVINLRLFFDIENNMTNSLIILLIEFPSRIDSKHNASMRLWQN